MYTTIYVYIYDIYYILLHKNDNTGMFLTMRFYFSETHLYMYT